MWMTKKWDILKLILDTMNLLLSVYINSEVGVTYTHNFYNHFSLLNFCLFFSR